MYPRLFHIYGPLYIHSYGLMIVIGLLVFAWLFLRHPAREALLDKEQFFTTVSWSIISALVGGHLLYVLTSQPTFEALITPSGLSILGSVIGVFVFLLLYLRYQKIPVLPFMDLASMYAPIVQGFGRIGCFLAGCCYGSPTSVPWAVVYTNPDVEAPLCIALHPSQLYSAALLFGISFLLSGWLQYRFKKPGQLVALYLILVSAERFITDFFRTDHQLPLSSYQLISLLMMCGALGWLILLSRSNRGNAR